MVFIVERRLLEKIDNVTNNGCLMTGCNDKADEADEAAFNERGSEDMS